MATSQDASQLMSLLKIDRRDLGILAAWLTKNSVQSGYVPNLPPTQTNRGDTSTYRIQYGEFSHMARHIVRENTMVSVPANVLTLLQGLIATRCGVIENSSLRYRGGASKFLVVLKATLGLLQQTTSVRRDNTTNTHNDSVADVRAIVEFDENEAEFEMLFATELFLNDLQLVSLYLTNAWDLYTNGKMELMQSTLITDFAIRLARQEEEDFETYIQRPVAYPYDKYPLSSLTNLLFLLHVPTDISNDSTTDLNGVRNAYICGCEICLSTMYMPQKMAKMYAEVLQSSGRKHVCLSTNYECPAVPKFSKTREVSTVIAFIDEQSLKTNNMQATSVSRIIRPQMASLTILLKTGVETSLMLKNKGYLTDEIMQAFTHIGERADIPVWVSFALTIQVFILSSGPKVGEKAVRDVKQAFEEAESRQIQHVQWKAKTGLNGLGTDIEKILSDFVTSFKKVVNLPALPLLPSTCGIIKFHMQMNSHHLGVALAIKTNYLQMTCHLYNASNIATAEPVIWPDMEVLIRHQGSETIFAGPRPTNMIQVYHHFKAFCMDKSAHSMPLAGDTGTKHYSLVGRRLQVSALANILYGTEFVEQSLHSHATVCALLKLLSDEKYQVNLREFFSTARYSGPRRSQWLEMLDALSAAVVAEMPGIMIDYFSMVRNCCEILGKFNRDGAKFLAILPSTRVIHGRANNPAVLTNDLLNVAINQTLFFHLVYNQDVSEARTHLELIRPLLENIEDAIIREHMKVQVNNIKRLAEGGQKVEILLAVVQAHLLKKTFEPFSKPLAQFLTTSKPDEEVNRLRKVVDQSTTCGMCLFRSVSLQRLYGTDSPQSWSHLVLDEATFQQRSRYVTNIWKK